MTPTLRRLNDRERYWGLTWPGWLAAGSAGGVLYGAVKLSPFGFKPTLTIVAFLIALFATVLVGVSGQALSPGRQLRAIASYRRSPKRWELSGDPETGGLVLAAAPERTGHDHGNYALADEDAAWDASGFTVGDGAEWLLREDAEEVLE